MPIHIHIRYINNSEWNVILIGKNYMYSTIYQMALRLNLSNDEFKHFVKQFNGYINKNSQICFNTYDEAVTIKENLDALILMKNLIGG